MYRYVEVWTKPALAENAAARSADESHVRQFVERTTRIDAMSLRLDLPLIFMKFLIDGDGDVFMSLKIPELHHSLTLPRQLSPATGLFGILLNCLVFASAG
jgi:hypothetical protein